MNPWIVLIILIVLFPVVMYFANKDIEKQNKKVEDHYKMMETKRQAEYEALQKEAERDAEIDAKLEKIREEYKAQNNSD